MINIEEAQIGDFVYALLTVQSAPVFAEITKVLDRENALEIRTDIWGQRIVVSDNAYWEEKAAKKGKIVRIEHNYKQWAQEYYSDEEEKTNNRIDTLHHGPSEVSENQRKTSGTKSISKSVKRKQKVVRKSTPRKRNTSRNRKPSSRKK